MVTSRVECKSGQQRCRCEGVSAMPYIQVADGTRLAYEDYGAGAPILFLAGWVLNAEMWEYQVPFFLERGYRCVLLDRRGHGRSDRPAAGYDADTRADDVAALVEQLDLRDLVVVTHSSGGGEAARYVTRHGADRVAKLAFIAATLPCLELTDDNPEGLPTELSQAQMAQWRVDRPRWFADRAQGYFATHLGNQVSPALIEHEIRRCLSASPYATAAMWQSNFETDFRPDLQGITVPTLVVHGVPDQSAPIEITGRRTAKLVPHCVYKEYPTAGHGLYVTHATQLNGDLLEFIED
ncbi:alpha/beta fold hydrolase [Nocardia brasiliensis]|uniref:alpha/beta fold hydrolase n=1 Tax=Nocardia brasiliensis TaxID=37326 RepID=UPI003D911B76